METRIVKVRGGKKEDVLSKKHNIFIGISMGNKWFTKEHIKEYIEWALKNTKEKVLIWIADKIHAVNYEVKNNQSHENALKRALREGDKKMIIIKEMIQELSKKERERIDIARWGDLEVLNYHIKLKDFFHEKFSKDKKFKESVLDVVTSTISLSFTNTQIEKLSEYVLNELPEILATFTFKGVEYGCYPYPINTNVAAFVEKIQDKEIFPEIAKELKFKNMVCVQLEIIK